MSVTSSGRREVVWSRLVPVVCIACLLNVGCSQAETRDGSAAPRSSATADVTTLRTTGETTPTGSVKADLACRAARRIGSDLEWPLTQAMWLVTSDLDGRSAAASAKVRVATERRIERLSARCAELPREIRALWRRTRALTRADLGLRGVRQLEESFGEWAKAYRTRNPIADATSLVEHCRAVSDSFRAGYELWWDYAPYGRRWWIVLVFDNETDRTPFLTLGGSLWATEMIGADRWTPSDGRGHQARWGASSFDYAEAPPGRSTMLVALGAGSELRTRATGEIYRVRAEVYMDNKYGSCSLPVPRLN